MQHRIILAVLVSLLSESTAWQSSTGHSAARTTRRSSSRLHVSSSYPFQQLRQQSLFQSTENYQHQQRNFHPAAATATTTHHHHHPQQEQLPQAAIKSSQNHHHSHHSTHHHHHHTGDDINSNTDDILASSPSTFLNKASATARKNYSRTARFTQRELDSPFGEGTFRYVAAGEYVAGPRAGQACVGKFFRQDGAVYEDRYYDTDIKVTEKATQLVALWNQEEIILDMVHVNNPEVWTFHKNSDPDWRDTKVLIEPYIAQFMKFNSNSGWHDSSFDWGAAMQALSHFSYHISGGKYLLCDLQGGVTPNGLILTDPAIISTEIGQYGPTDLGPEGMDLFFQYHRCNEFCRHHWLTPSRLRESNTYRPRRGTTMVRVDDDNDVNRKRQQQQQSLPRHGTSSRRYQQQTNKQWYE